MNIERILHEVSKTQEFEPNDKLSRMISRYRDNEISEEDLFMISAANKPSFDNFMLKLKDK